MKKYQLNVTVPKENLKLDYLIERAIELDLQWCDLEYGVYTNNVRAIADILELDYMLLKETVRKRFLASVE